MTQQWVEGRIPSRTVASVGRLRGPAVMRKSLRRAVGAVLATALLATAACSSGAADGTSSSTSSSSPTGGSTSTAEDPDTDPTVQPAAEDEPVFAALAAAGIDVIPDDAPRPPSGTVAVTGSQATVWADQVRRSAGLTGGELRERFPTDDTAVPLDALIAAWLTSSQGPAADAARTLVDPAAIEDPKDFRFPWAVIAMFVEDVTTTSADAPATTPSGFRAPGDGSFDPCGALTGMYQSVVAKITSWFSTTGSDSTIVAIAGEALSLFGQFLGKAISAVLAPLLAPIKAAVGAVGLAASIAGALVPWTASIANNPDQTAFGITPQPGNKGAFQLTVTTPLPDWPAALKSCASLIGVELPPITPAGSEVTWTFHGGVAATEEHHDATLGQGAAPTARLDFITGTESAEQAKGSPIVDPVYVSAQVTRDTTALQAVLNQLIGSVLDMLPDLIALLVIDPATQALSSVLDLVGPEEVSDPVYVTHHQPPDEPKDNPPGGPPGADPPAPPVERTCVGTKLRSHYQQAKGMDSYMPGGVVLWLAPDGSGFMNFNTASPYLGDHFAALVKGSITLHWSGSPTKMTSRADSGTVRVKIATEGIVTAEIKLPAKKLLVNAETFLCDDGVLTIQRTGWTFD